jgi:hypothetical protein
MFLLPCTSSPLTPPPVPLPPTSILTAVDC